MPLIQWLQNLLGLSTETASEAPRVGAREPEQGPVLAREPAQLALSLREVPLVEAAISEVSQGDVGAGEVVGVMGAIGEPRVAVVGLKEISDG